MTATGPKDTWKIWIDTGGTFTDCLAIDPHGKLHRAKVLSSSALRGKIIKQSDSEHLRIEEKWNVPSNFVKGFKFRLLEQSSHDFSVEEYDPADNTLRLNKPLRINNLESRAFEVSSADEAPILAARMVTQTLPDKALPNIAMRLATTRGTNALLERKGVPTVLFITQGFGDLLRIGNQQRPDIFALEIIKPAPLYVAVVEVAERLNADGSILRPLALEKLQTEVRGLKARGIEVAAIALMHSYLNPGHERRLASLLRKHGFTYVSCSSDLAPFIKIVPRAETTVVDAYLSPVISDYLQKVNSSLSSGKLHVMTSAGGLVNAADFHAKDSLLSGPAGGVVGAALSGKRSGFEKVIVFDMGGTSTDVARYDGDFEYVFEHQVGDAHLSGAALAIESVAAGGGSICRFDGYRLRVGPESAGAQPGPACYGSGGPLTLTDVNLLLGRLNPDRFEIPISLKNAESEFEKVQTAITRQSGHAPAKEELLHGFLDIANERMADTIRRVSVRKGVDPQNYALVGFGGAGGQHACGVAHRLGIKTVIVPQDASLLSAFGLGHAVLERFSQKQVLKKLKEVEAEIPHLIEELSAAALQAVVAEGIDSKEIEVRRRIINMRFVGQDSILTVEYDPALPLKKAFEDKYQEVFAHLPGVREIEVESVRVISSTRADDRKPSVRTGSIEQVESKRFIRAFFGNCWQDVSVYERKELKPGSGIIGPALVFEQHSATVIEQGWNARVDAASALVLTVV